MMREQDWSALVGAILGIVIGLLAGSWIGERGMLDPDVIIERGGFEQDDKVYLVVPAPEAIRITPDGPARLIDNQPED